MSWPLFLAVVWGLATTAAWSHAAAPARRILITLLESGEAAAGFREPWVSKGPCCPACVGFWAALGLSAMGLGPAGVAPVVVAFAAYGAVLLAAAAFKRLALGTDL